MIDIKEIGKLIGEEVANEPAIGFYPGGFKPPHKGHFAAAKQLAAKPYINQVKVLIGHGLRDGITAEQSKAIWDLYLKAEPNPKISVEISPDKSPIKPLFSYFANLDNRGYVAGGKNEIESGYFDTLKEKFADRVMPQIVNDEFVDGDGERVSGTEFRATISELKTRFQELQQEQKGTTEYTVKLNDYNNTYEYLKSLMPDSVINKGLFDDVLRVLKLNFPIPKSLQEGQPNPKDQPQYVWLEEDRWLEEYKNKNKFNPAVFDGENLDPKVKELLLKIATYFWETLELEEPFEDVTLTGSSANYNYTPYSDIDLHILIDFNKFENLELIKKYFDSKKVIFNNKHDLKLGKQQIEVYIQDINEPHTSTGVYSVMNDNWVKKPEYESINIPDGNIKRKSKPFKEMINDLTKNGHKNPEKSINQIKKLKERIKNFRQSGLDKNGEYSLENLAFKDLRNTGYLDKLSQLSNNLVDKQLSLNEGTENNIFEKFMSYACQELNIKNPPTFEIRTEFGEEQPSFGAYVPSDHHIFLNPSNRNIVDILRTLAHELVHAKQNELELLEPNSGDTGSDIENDANAIAGILMRDYGKNNPDIYNIGMLNEEKNDWKKTSWENEKGQKITLPQLLNIIKDYPIIQAPIEKVKKIVIKKDTGGIESNRLDKANTHYPIIIVVDSNNNYKYILDGNHRANKAIDDKEKTIPAKLVDINKLPKKFQDVLNESKKNKNYFNDSPEFQGNGNPLNLKYIDTWHDGQDLAFKNKTKEAIKVMTQAAKEAKEFAKNNDNNLAEFKYYLSTIDWLKGNYKTAEKYINDKEVINSKNDEVLKRLLQNKDKSYEEAYGADLNESKKTKHNQYKEYFLKELFEKDLPNIEKISPIEYIVGNGNDIEAKYYIKSENPENTNWSIHFKFTENNKNNSSEAWKQVTATSYKILSDFINNKHPKKIEIFGDTPQKTNLYKSKSYLEKLKAYFDDSYIINNNDEFKVEMISINEVAKSSINKRMENLNESYEQALNYFKYGDLNAKSKIERNRALNKQIKKQVMNEIYNITEERPKITRIYLDMDGVIAGFDEKFRQNNKDGIDFKDYIKEYGANEAWKIINDGGSEYWSSMGWNPGGKQLYDYVTKMADKKDIEVWVLSSPGLDPNGDTTKGKNEWLDKNTSIPQNQRVFKRASDKHTEAQPGYLLIDDMGRNVSEFINAGGYGIKNNPENSMDSIKKLHKFGL
jgi:predicted nucleotidyltransferase